jgi:acyl-CoA thioesterase I
MEKFVFTRKRAGRLSRALALVFLLSAAAAACGGEGARETARGGQPRPAGFVDPTGQFADARPQVVVLGDSLTAGLGLPLDQAFPAVLQRRIDEAGYDFAVVNMGVSGDTSAGGLRRLDWALEGDVRVLVLALGANDGLRGLSPREMEANLGRIVDRARDQGAAVLLCGMEAPPNFGASYTEEFRQAYRRLAREKRVEFLPFLLDGVAGARALTQADGIHPNAEGARLMAELVWARLQPMLDAMTSS